MTLVFHSVVWHALVLQSLASLAWVLGGDLKETGTGILVVTQPGGWQGLQTDRSGKTVKYDI